MEHPRSDLDLDGFKPVRFLSPSASYLSFPVPRQNLPLESGFLGRIIAGQEVQQD